MLLRVDYQICLLIIGRWVDAFGTVKNSLLPFPRQWTVLDRQKAISTIVWAAIALGIILVINLVIFLIMGFWNPILLLIVMSNLTFFEAGIIMVIGGIALMIGGFPSIARTIYNEWNPKKAKETREMSYTPLLLSVFLFLVSIITSLFVS